MDTYLTVRLVRKDKGIVLKDRIIVKYGMLQHGTVWYSTVRYYTVRYGTVPYGTVRYGAVPDNRNVNNNV